MKNTLARRLLTAGSAAVTLLLFSSCETSSTKVTDVWAAPDITQLHFTKVLGVAAMEAEGTRRVFEDALVQAMPNVKAIPGYMFLVSPADLKKDGAKLTAEMKAAGFDGVVIIRLVGDRKETSVNTTTDYYGAGYPMGGYYGVGPYPVGYRNFGGYYNNYAMPAYSTTTVTEDRIVSVETNLYEFPSEKLVWSSIAQSTSPGDIPDLLNKVVEAVRKEMSKQKLIAPPPAK